MIVLLSIVAQVHAADDEQKGRNVQLFNAFKNGEPFARIKALVGLGAEVKAVEEQTLDGYGALHYVVLRCYAADKNAFARYLIEECEVNVDDKASIGSTPCQLAASCNKDDWIEILVTNGADVNAKDNAGDAPLHYAAYQNSLEAVTALVTYEKIDVNAKNEDKDTPLHIACRVNARKIVAVLLEHGAKVQEKNKRGFTPLALARKFNSQDVVQYLEDWETFPDVKEP